jgi:hypothetical protein
VQFQKRLGTWPKFIICNTINVNFQGISILIFLRVLFQRKSDIWHNLSDCTNIFIHNSWFFSESSIITSLMALFQKHWINYPCFGKIICNYHPVNIIILLTFFLAHLQITISIKSHMQLPNLFMKWRFVHGFRETVQLWVNLVKKFVFLMEGILFQFRGTQSSVQRVWHFFTLMINITLLLACSFWDYFKFYMIENIANKFNFF